MPGIIQLQQIKALENIVNYPSLETLNKMLFSLENIYLELTLMESHF